MNINSSTIEWILILISYVSLFVSYSWGKFDHMHLLEVSDKKKEHFKQCSPWHRVHETKVSFVQTFCVIRDPLSRAISEFGHVARSS